MNEIKQEYINQFDDVIHRALKHYKDFQTDMNTLYPQSITSTELSIIKVVNIKPDIIIKEISESLSVPGSTLTSAIDRLEEKKLINRIISKKNRHSFGLELTEEGKKLNIEHEKAERQVWNKILSLLDNDKERELLIYLLSSIVNKLDMR